MCVRKHTKRGRQDRINNKQKKKKKELGHWKIRCRFPENAATFPKTPDRLSQKREGGWDTTGITNLLLDRLLKCAYITHAWGSSHSFCIRG